MTCLGVRHRAYVGVTLRWQARREPQLEAAVAWQACQRQEIHALFWLFQFRREVGTVLSVELGRSPGFWDTVPFSSNGKLSTRAYVYHLLQVLRMSCVNDVFRLYGDLATP